MNIKILCTRCSVVLEPRSRLTENCGCRDADTAVLAWMADGFVRMNVGLDSSWTVEK